MKYCFFVGIFIFLGVSAETDHGWIKVFNHNTAGGLFSSSADALSKNVDNPSSNLYSILGQLEDFRSNGGFHFKLCYPELVSYNNGDGCNEWIQTSNPATDTIITGFKPIKLSFTKDSYRRPWVGIGKNYKSYPTFIDDAPTESNWYTAIGSCSYWPKANQKTIPGPNIWKNHDNLRPVTKVELYVKSTPNRIACKEGWTLVAPETRIYFQVRGKTDAHVLLSEKGCKHCKCADCDGYEIVIGGWTNTQSVIRDAKQKPHPGYAVTSTPDILSLEEYREFYISLRLEVTWHGKKINIGVGKKGEEPFMSYSIDYTHPIKYIGFAGWQTNTNDYIFKSEKFSVAGYNYFFIEDNLA